MDVHPLSLGESESDEEMDQDNELLEEEVAEI
jgi:hypothetical protein